MTNYDVERVRDLLTAKPQSAGEIAEKLGANDTATGRIVADALDELRRRGQAERVTIMGVELWTVKETKR